MGMSRPLWKQIRAIALGPGLAPRLTRKTVAQSSSGGCPIVAATRVSPYTCCAACRANPTHLRLWLAGRLRGDVSDCSRQESESMRMSQALVAAMVMASVLVAAE